MRRILLAAVAIVLVLSGVAMQGQQALNYSRLVVFGDNYSDTLNTYQATFTRTSGYDATGDPITITDAFPSYQYGYVDGMFTNGPLVYSGSATAYSGVWHQQLHGLLPGVPLAAPPLNSGVSTAGSTNYAWGGATTASGTTTVNYAGHFTVAAHNLNRQIDDYLNAGNVLDAKSLYVLFGGLNDLLTDSSTASATAAAANVAAEAKRLIDGGAVNVLVANAPGISANANTPIDVAAGVFRTQLAFDLATLQAGYALQGTKVKLTTLDVAALYANIFANPGNFGFTDVVDAANASSATGFYPANADVYLKWDTVNPTTAGHHQIAIAACTALTGSVTNVTASTLAPTVAAPATLTAAVSTSGTYGPGSATSPTGSVTFYYPQTILTTTTKIALGTVPLGANGQASLTTAALPLGAYSVYAVYNGDANFAPGCNSNAVALTVAVAAKSFDFTFSPTAGYIGMEEGVPLVITPVPIGGFTGSVAFSCSSLPKFFTCNWTYDQTVQIVGGGTVYYPQVFISSGTPTKLGKAVSPPLLRLRGIAGQTALAVLLAGPLAMVAARRKRLRGLRLLGSGMMLLLIALGMVAASGCATAKSATTSPANQDVGYGVTHGPGITYAAPGSYAIQITGTSGSLSVTHTYYIYIADTFDVGVIP